MKLQRSAAGVCVALLLVGGLVSMPTSCDCGAGISHGHSLFILAGHHHGSGGVSFGSDDGHKGHHNHEFPSLEPQFTSGISHASDRVAVALPPQMLLARGWQRITYPRHTDHPVMGLIISPDAPPPQVLVSF